MDHLKKPTRHPPRSPAQPMDTAGTHEAAPADPARSRRTFVDDHGSRDAHDAAVSEGWPVARPPRPRRTAARS
jgi:hypothetical protein